LTEGAFELKGIPRDNVVEGAVPQLDDLRGEETSSAILAGEQVSRARLEGEDELPGGALGIPDGYQALTLPLQVPRSVGGVLATNDSVTIYGSLPKNITGTKEVTVSLAEHIEILAIRYDAALEEDEPTSTETALVTLALKPADSQRVVFNSEFGTVWLSLEAPDAETKHGIPTYVGQVIR
jgi:pilus assembly protein CpaB